MSKHDDDDRDYGVGYRRPPKETRFKKGQSGNPKGRPKGSRNLSKILEEALFRKVSIKDERGTRDVVYIAALVQKLSVDALKGDSRAQAKILELIKFHEARCDEGTNSDATPSDRAAFKVTEADLEIMRQISRDFDITDDRIEEKPP